MYSSRDKHGNIQVLTTDFSPDREAKVRKKVMSNNVAFYKCFATPDGQKVLDVLDSLTAGKIIDLNVHTTIANAARRDLVDLMRLSSQRGLEELKK